MKEHGPIEIRSAAPISAVTFPERTIELIAVPYDEWTWVEHRGRMIEESVAPGAFGSVEKRAQRINVYMEHDREHRVGFVQKLRADNPPGLWAQLLIRQGSRDVLDDAADGMLSASVGMAVSPDDQTWEHGRRRIHRAYLDHIGMTAQPAYTGAEILDVRHKPTVIATPVSATPNLDRILEARRLEAYSPR